MADTERMKVTVTEVKDVEKIQRRDGQGTFDKLVFKAKHDDKMLGFQCLIPPEPSLVTSISLKPSIKPG